jgi:hypothetical protein
MNVLEFKELDKPQQQDIVYCILDRIDYCANTSIREVVENVADWTLQNITIQGYTVLVSKDEDALLRRAVDLGFNHAVVLSTGTEFINGYDCFEQLAHLTKTHFFLAGHILDRDDGYYELHHQCYVINLKIYKQLNCPVIGQQELNSEHTQIAPMRSELNYHDSHTPIWVALGNVQRNYKHKAHGWNILSVAFSNAKHVQVFTSYIRDSKKHYYPEYPESYMNEINYVYNRDAFCSGVAVYPFNSESFKQLPVSNVEQLVVPAAGLNWMLLVNNYCTDDVVIKFYDYSLPTLNFIRKLFSDWDGIDYVKFVNSYLTETFGFIANKHEIPFCGPQDLETEWLKFKDDCHWDKFKKLKVEFHWVNLLDTSKSLYWIDQNKNTLINASNIFNYIGTAMTYNLEARKHAEQKFLEQVPNAFVLLGRKADAGLNHQVPTWKTV